MRDEILGLKQKNYTIAQIAEELGLSVGQVKYQLYRKKGDEETEKGNIEETEQTNIEEREKSNIKEIGGWQAYYSENKIVAMPAGEHSIYTYWEVTWSRMNHVAQFAEKDFRELQKVLRVFDVTDIIFDGSNAHSHRDIWINNEADNWYIHDLPAGRNYVVDYGVYAQTGFVSLMRSNMASLIF